MCTVQDFARVRIIQSTGEFGFTSENYDIRPSRRFMALRRALIAALKYRLRILGLEYLRLSAFCSYL